MSAPRKLAMALLALRPEWENGGRWEHRVQERNQSGGLQ